MAGLTASQLISLLRTTQTNFKKNTFEGSQALQSYAVSRELANLETVPFYSNEYGWVVYMKPNSGSVRGVNFYEATEAIKSDPPVQAKVGITLKESKGIVYDLREMALNAGGSRIVDHYKTEREAAMEAIANHMEDDLIKAPFSSSDTLSFNGIPTYLRPSVSSGAAFVANTAGSFSGQRIRYRDGSVNGTLANIDATNADNERWRNMVATHSGVMDLTLARKIRELADKTRFEPFPMRRGETTVSDCVLFMNQDFHEKYKQLVEAGPDDRGRGGSKADLFPFSQFDLGQMRVIRAPKLDADPLSPIYAMRLSKWKWAKLDGFWMKEGEPITKGASGAHNVVYIPIDFCGQLICTNPREGGFVIHGSF